MKTHELVGIFLAIYVFFLITSYIKTKMRVAMNRRLAALDDKIEFDGVEFDGWKNGNPNEPIPEDAERFDPLAVYDGNENLGRLSDKR